MRFLFIILVFIGLSAAAQKDSSSLAYLPNKGVIAFGGTFSPNLHLRNNGKNFYFHGYLEYFFTRRISLRGNFFGLMVSGPQPRKLLHNHHIVYGGLVHFPIKNFDAYVGIEPGVALTQTRYTNEFGQELRSKFAAVPMLTAAVGCRYFIGKFFNFSFECRYSHGKHFDIAAYYLDAITFSLGLGFNFDAFPKK